MRQPNFFVVGAAKSGTTALWRYLHQHPQIFVTDKIEYKELGYFTKQYGISDKSRYLKFFKNASENQLIGEVCHAYLTSEESAKWIKRDIPEAKILMILRNPAERAFSLYNWMVMEGYENEITFERALKREKRINTNRSDCTKLLHSFKQNYNYFNSGLYYEQIKKYYEVFGKESVLVIEYSDFKNNTQKVLECIFKFLNVDSFTIKPNYEINKSTMVYSTRLQYIARKQLLNSNKRNKMFKILFEFILKKNIRKGKPKNIREKTFHTLKSNYKSDVEKLSNLTTIDFKNKWNIK
jgi:hypothetical protein